MTLSDTTPKRIIAATLVGGLVTITQLTAPAAHAAPKTVDCGYSGETTTQTGLSISPVSPKVGQQFTATATVRAAGKPVTGGTVTFSYAGSTAKDTVSGGTAQASFTAQKGSNTLSASYSGVCLVGKAAIGISASTKPVVAGVEANVGGVSAGLAPTGLDSKTELYALGGLALVSAGGVVLIVRRRRAHA